MHDSSPSTATCAASPTPDQIRSLFREHRIRTTRQREMVYSALVSSKNHPTAEELLVSVRAKSPGISQATVYNTLDALTDCGLARRLPSRNAGGACRFDADVRSHVHVTMPDGRLVDAPDSVSLAVLDALQEAGLDDGTGKRVASIQIDLR